MRPLRILYFIALLAVTACGTRVEQEAEATSTALPAGTVLPEVRTATADDVMQFATAPGARVTLVNVWATWCGPCREEFPDLVKLKQNYADSGLRVIFVSADFEEQTDEVRRFLAAHGVADTTLLKTGDDMKFIDTLDKRWTGAIPATFLYDAAGRQRAFWEGRVDYAKFQSEVKKILDQPKPEEARS
jgi:thiol-disulfide isomerase/thioredoxin